MALLPVERILVSFATPAEIGKVELFLKRVRRAAPTAHLLAVNDVASDEARAFFDRLEEQDRRFCVVHRPGPLGVGSAHKLSMLYARRHRFDALVTLEADGSNRPEDLERLIAELSDAEFVVAASRPRSTGVLSSVRSLALGGDAAPAASLYRAYRLELLERLDVDSIAADDAS